MPKNVLTTMVIELLGQHQSSAFDGIVDNNRLENTHLLDSLITIGRNQAMTNWP